MNNHYDPNQPRNAEGEWTDAGAAIRAAASDNKVFREAKTIQEAEERIKKAGVSEVDLKGLKPEQFNAVLEAVEEENKISPLMLSKLTTYRSSNSNAKALYSPSNNHLTINLSKLKVDEYKPLLSYEQQILSAEEGKNFIRDNYLAKPGFKQTTVYSRMNAYNNRIYDLKQKVANGEMPRHWTISAGIQDKSKSLKATIHHEIGHYRLEKQVKGKAFFSLNTKESVSEYGRTNNDEYFAEGYSHYRMYGEKGVPRNLIEIFKSIK